MGREMPAREDVGMRGVPSRLRPTLSRLAPERPLKVPGKHGQSLAERNFVKAPPAHLHEETGHGGPFGVAAHVGALGTGLPAPFPTSA